MELANKVLFDNKIKKDSIEINVDNVNTSWMTKPQLIFFKLLIDEKNRTKSYSELSELAGYKSKASWYTAISDKRYEELLTKMGVDILPRIKMHKSHKDIKYIENITEKNIYLNSDIWDTRKLFKEYPRHRPASDYIIRFEKINNKQIREIVKRYYKNMLANWKPASFRCHLDRIIPFLNTMNDLFPNITSFDKLDREIHVEFILKNSTWSNNSKREGLRAIKAMFEYMHYNKWKDAPQLYLLNKLDIPKREETIPRPIPPNIKIQLDEFIETAIIPLLEEGKPTPIISAKYWDLIIIIRNTGRRIEDICHLISRDNDKNKECLQYDLDNDPMLYLDHRIAKIPKDLRIPLAHLKDSNDNNVVENAILRQLSRVEDLNPAPDGYNYLFREIRNSNTENVEIITYDKFNGKILSKICNEIPLTCNDGTIYKISSHQFRHTVATEMIDAGVDIYAVKEFLGHSSVSMTEKYIKVYQQTLKREFKEKLSKSDATDIKSNLSEQNDLYTNKWVKNKIIGVFELGDGCCEHPYKMPSCPHMACKICVKKKIYPRHLQAVKDTIESETVHKDNALLMGLNDKAEEFNKVVTFYKIALEIINKGETFDASKHFYTKGVQ